VTKKGRLQMLGRVREARKRLRDAAAGDLAAAEAEMAEADERHEEAIAGLDEVKDRVVAELAEARTVLALWAYEHEHRVAAGNVTDAARVVEVAREESARHRAVLVTRARELKTAEKVIDRTRADVRSDERRAEQKLSDDLSGRARRDEP
jgi:flagellar export protein FliJ